MTSKKAWQLTFYQVINGTFLKLLLNDMLISKCHICNKISKKHKNHQLKAVKSIHITKISVILLEY